MLDNVPGKIRYNPANSDYIMNMRFSIFFLIVFITVLPSSFGQDYPSRQRPASSFPDSVRYEVRPYYRHRQDGKPGREVMLYFPGNRFVGRGTLSVEYNGQSEKINIEKPEGIDSLAVLLPEGIGVSSDDEVTVQLSSGRKKITTGIRVPRKRQWTVYIYPHSHVDIGYTNTHENVELIHKRNLIYGIDLAKRTQNYPDGAKYLWNPEVLWPVERYLSKANERQKQAVIEAVQKGWLQLDAGYVHTNTSAAADEELFEFFRICSRMKELTGKNIETLVQVDIPGMTWGIVPVAAAMGIKYCLALNNGFDRVGLSTDLSFKPFWWKSQDGKSRILFFQPGSYNPGAIYKGFQYWPLMAGHTDSTTLLKIVKSDNPRAFFVDKYLAEKLPMLENSNYYPYDIFLMTWAMADNTPIDADLPEAVRSWNEEYAYPHLIIAGATQMMKAFDDKYGDSLPVLSGDFTEYWTDGLGTAAKYTAMNRASKERLIQVETLWAMLNRDLPPPRREISEAWRNIILGTEHTWCFMDPQKQPITNDILKVKFGFFETAREMSSSLLDRSFERIRQENSRFIAVFNTLSWERDGIIYLAPDQAGNYNSVIDDKGRQLSCQKLASGGLVFAAGRIPALGSVVYTLSKKKVRSAGAIAAGYTLDNGIIRVTLDPRTGDISSLISSGYDYAESGSESLINSYRYLHGEDPPEKATSAKNVRITLKENGPLLATLQVISDAEGCRSLVREITLYSGQPFVDIRNIVDKIAVTEKEGIHFGFGFNVPSPAVRFDIPWGVTELEKDQLPEANRNWITFQRWLDISNSDRGVTFCSPDAPLFQNGTITANILGGAANSPKWIRKLEPSSIIYSWALNNHWHTNFPLSQDGSIEFRYRLLPHNSGYDAAVSNRFGLEQAQPLIACPAGKEIQVQAPLQFEGSRNIFLTILKVGETGKSMILRFRSVSDSDEKITLNWPEDKQVSLRIAGPDERFIEMADDGQLIVPAKGFVTLEAEW